MRTAAFTFVLLWVAFVYGQKSETGQLLRLGISSFKACEYDSAEVYFSRGIEEKNFAMHILYYSRAYSRFKQNKYQEAAEDLKLALKEDQYYSNAYWLLGRIYSNQGKKSQAIGAFKKAKKYDASAVLYSNIALVKIEMGKYNSALKDLETAMKLDGENAYVFNNRAHLYTLLGKYNLASNDLEKSMLLKPDNPFVYINKARMLFRVGNPEEGCIMITKAFEIAKDIQLPEAEEMKKSFCP